MVMFVNINAIMNTILESFSCRFLQIAEHFFARLRIEKAVNGRIISYVVMQTVSNGDLFSNLFLFLGLISSPCYLSHPRNSFKRYRLQIRSL